MCTIAGRHKCQPSEIRRNNVKYQHIGITRKSSISQETMRRIKTVSRRLSIYIRNGYSSKPQIQFGMSSGVHTHNKNPIAIVFSLPLQSKDKASSRMRLRTICNARGKRAESLEFNIEFESHGEIFASDVSSNKKGSSKEEFIQTNGSLYENSDLVQPTKEISFPIFRPPPKRWIIVFLCFFAFLLCNMDRVRANHLYFGERKHQNTVDLLDNYQSTHGVFQ